MSAPVSGSKEQVGRLLTLVPYLHARGGVHLQEAAADLDTTPAQLLKDLKVLLMCGLPGGYPDDLIDVDLDALEGRSGDGVIRVSNADYLSRPLRLTPTEGTAVVVALRALRNSADPSTCEIVDRTLAKLDAALADVSAAAAHIEPGASVDASPEPSYLGALREALERGVEVTISYFVPARDEVTERRVDPRGVVTIGRGRYLDAWCHTAEDDRTFRLDRIRAVTVHDTPAAHLNSGDERDDAAAAPALFDRSTATPVTLRVEPAARWIIEYYDVDAVRELGDGAAEVDLRVADPRWLTRLLLRLSPSASVVSPTHFRDQHRAAVGSALALYSVLS